MLIEAKKIHSLYSKELFNLGLMMLLTIFTQAIMLIKLSVTASVFGASIEMDAFNFANSVGTFVYSFIGAGITTVLIPNLVNNDNKESINIFISVLYSVAFIVLIIIYLSRKILINSLSNGSEAFIALTCNIMLITLISEYINSFTGTTNAILQCNGKFNFPKIITLLTSVLLVLLIIFNKNLTIYKYAFLILVTTIINVICQIYLALKSGYIFKYKISIKDREFLKMIKIFAPTVLGAGLYQISLLIDSIISSNLGPGMISKLSYSNTLMGMINTVIISNIMTYFYPKIAKNVNNRYSQKMLFDLSILINGIMILIVVGFVIVGREGIVILYERGKFTYSVTTVVYICTLIYIIGLPANAFRDLIYRYFYAKKDTLTPLKNGLIISCLNIVISILLCKYLGIYGIIVGSTITYYMSLVMILVKFNDNFGFKYSKKQLILENGKFIIAAILTILIIKKIRSVILNVNVLFDFIVYGICTVAIYVFFIWILKSRIFRLKVIS